MKKLVLILLVMLAISNFIQASEYWADINFTRDSVLWGQGTTPPQPNYQNYQNVTFGDFLINGFFGRFNASMRKVNSENLEETFIMSWRLSKNAANQLVFPKYNGIGRIKIHFFNNGAFSGYIPILRNQAEEGQPAEWVEFDPVIHLEFDADDASTSSHVIDQNLNIEGDTQIKIGPAVYDPSHTGNPYLQIYSITLYKDALTQLTGNFSDVIQISLNNRNLQVLNAGFDYQVNIYNLSGVRIGQISNNEAYHFMTAGHYILQLETKESVLIKKLVVF